ncbi:MAG: YaiI/YqxD family protein [Alphaproteobacteria bacterium]|nr:YaiI/YqxD family protein [Alphaproteobacteria bacterium]MCB9692418.1 YaiI/YqxD family protein [Alphaproteobacteria bacterium]
MIWVDADATPRAVKEMIYRASQRTGEKVILVANQWFQTPRSPTIELRVVGKGFDVADEHIAENVSDGDLVITQDVPLAVAAVEKGCLVIDNRGNIIDADNARARLSMRDFLETVRESGEMTGGPPPFSDKDKRRFAGELDRWLARRKA